MVKWKFSQEVKGFSVNKMGKFLAGAKKVHENQAGIEVSLFTFHLSVLLNKLISKLVRKLP